MSEQNVPLQELENLIELAKSRATTPVNFENSSPQASAPPPSYFTPSKAFTQQIEENTPLKNITFKQEDFRIIISDLKKCTIGLQGLAENQNIIHKSLVKVKENIHATEISMSKKANETQVTCSTFLNAFLCFVTIAFIVYHVFFQFKSYCYGK